MSECRWVATDQPRMLRTHERDCNTSGCPGCTPCPERHCALCGIEHVTHEGRGDDQVCAPCIGDVRTGIRAIVDMSERLLTEAVHRGVNSEAANLAGRTIDDAEGHEAWRYRAMSAAMGRIPQLDDDTQHPLWILGTWEMLVREHYDQPTRERLTLTAAREYLNGHLTRLAHDVDFAFEELARDVRGCQAHLEDVLREGERDDLGVTCPPCGRARLVKSYGKTEDDDRWTCPKCRQWWTDEDYRDKVSGIFVGVANELTDRDMETRTRVPAATVRSWAHRGKVRKRGRSADGRVLYDVADVERVRDEDAARSA